jgi:hypothetical protein
MIRSAIYLSTVLLLAVVAMSYDMPRNWRASGSNVRAYKIGTAPGAGHTGKNAGTIRGLKKEMYGYGRMTQTISADNYAGKRLRLSGYLKTQKVSQWAGLLLKAERSTDDPKTGRKITRTLTFDNMYNRSIGGTIDYTRYEVVIDVPDSATSICYGARLTGGGQIWFDDFKLEIVGHEIPTTNAPLKEPSNMDFSE